MLRIRIFPDHPGIFRADTDERPRFFRIRGKLGFIVQKYGSIHHLHVKTLKIFLRQNRALGR